MQQDNRTSNVERFTNFRLVVALHAASWTPRTMHHALVLAEGMPCDVPLQSWETHLREYDDATRASGFLDVTPEMLEAKQAWDDMPPVERDRALAETMAEIHSNAALKVDTDSDADAPSAGGNGKLN